MELALLLGTFLFMLLLGVPVAVAMLLSSIISILSTGLPLTIVAERLLSGVNSFTLLAVPFFILAAVIMNRGGLTRRLLGVARCFVGHFHGGTAQVDVLASIFFAGMSGSATADAASQGKMLIPHMEKEGYDLSFAAGITAASSTIGAIIPPSIAMIIYGSVTNISVGQLFLAGIVPGLAVGGALMVAVNVMSRRRGYPRSARMSWRESWPLIWRALPALLAPVIILGGIITGATTPTEAGVIACVYALFVSTIVYRELKLRDVMQVLAESVETASVPMFIIAAAASFGFVLTASGFGFIVQDVAQGITESPTVFLFLVVVLFLCVGLFVEATAAMLIFVPILMPLVSLYSLNPIQFAMIVIVTLLLGTITPPVGLQLYIVASIARISPFEVTVWPFVIVILVVVVGMVFFPGLATYLPSLLL
jgi:tripartite ATP-independent transporter DctM subunit